MSIEAMKLALEALTATMSTHGFAKNIEESKDKAITALRQAIEQAQKRPQNCGTSYCSCIECVMETDQTQSCPPQRQWVRLTDEEICKCAGIDGVDTWIFETAYAIEAKLKEKNT